MTTKDGGGVFTVVLLIVLAFWALAILSAVIGLGFHAGWRML